ncbi:MAG: glycosyltransferase family 2 protein [Deltaproteobacteria bacterium]|nr:glycosyltransferase family 2 protein [Deltaproteobacteria bacterium]
MIFIVLPVYNEQNNIGALLRNIDRSMKEYGHGYKVIMVNDGSTDNTLQSVEALKGVVPLLVLSHKKNSGVGEALKTGLVRAVELSEENDVIITMDADNTHVPGLIMRLNRNIWEGCDVVIASRFVRDARILGVPFKRRFLSGAASLLFRFFFPIRGVKDYTCGFRAYRAGLLQRAFQAHGKELVSESGFSCMIDVLLKLRKFNPIINEVPIILRYDRRASGSKMNVQKTIRDTLKLFFQRLGK